MLTLNKIINNKLCISCGICASMAYPSSLPMHYSKKNGMLYPDLRSELLNEEYLVDICPGKGYDIKIEGTNLFANCNYDTEIGFSDSYTVVRSTNRKIMANATSGGAMTAIASYLLTKNIISGVIVSSLSIKRTNIIPISYIARNTDQLLSAQGSKYCPVPALNILHEIKDDDRLLFIGTPCQIAGVRNLQRLTPKYKDLIPFAIGNFCGGFRDMRETEAIIRRLGFKIEDLSEFRYRYGGQPGFLFMKDNKGNECRSPYPGYSKLTGYLKHRRCRLCVDATAELADFACGDAWLPRFRNTGQPWSIVISRNPKSTAIINEMVQNDLLITDQISAQEIKESQKINLLSKKTRQFSRRKLFTLFGIAIPTSDTGYEHRSSGLLKEVKITLIQNTIYLLERIGLYPVFYSILKKVKK